MAALTGSAGVPAVAHALHVAVAGEVLKRVLKEDNVHICTGLATQLMLFEVPQGCHTDSQAQLPPHADRLLITHPATAHLTGTRRSPA